ncbi:MAG: hypothetical protein QXV22_04580 [Thermoplasmataceae archaeon]
MILDLIIPAIFIAILVGITLVTDFRKFYIAYAICAPFSIASYFLTGNILASVVLILSIVSAKFLYSTRFNIFAGLLFAIVISILVLGLEGIYWITFDLFMGIGTAIGLLTDRSGLSYSKMNDSSKGKSLKIEISRDLVQIGGGIIILVAILEMSLTLSRIVITMLVIPLYVIGNYYAINSSNTIGRTLFYFERPMTPLGLGAIWFSAGLLIAAGTVTTTAMLATVVFISTIGDPLATIVGSNIKSPRLPYNKRKSIAGFSAILISSALFAYFMVGAYGISLGVLSAVLESLSLHPIDDNFLVPTVLSIAARMV